MDYRLDCEVRLADHHAKTAAVDVEGWKRPASVARYRVTLAQVLIALAVRIAPTVTQPNSSTAVLAP
jgi:hypothetical protein